jgi:hypothetical protein
MKITKSDLQVLAGLVVTESELTKESKLSLLNFVQNEASIHQLMSFLMDGKVRTISESEKSIVKDKFVASKYPKFISEASNFVNEGGEDVAVGIGIAAYVAFLGGMVYLGALSDWAMKQKFLAFCRHKHGGKTSAFWGQAREITNKGAKVEEICQAAWAKERESLMALRNKARMKK